MKVLIVYCHPSSNSFTYQVKESFIQGLKEANHSYEISDLYGDHFNPVMSEKEYLREGFYHLDESVENDVFQEQMKINQADVIVFIYPDFWTASPAMLEGWFQRVWTYGFAYGDHPTMKCLDKAIFLMTMGGTLHDQLRRDQVEAMKTTMIGDRMNDRVKACEFYVFDRMTRGYDNEENRKKRMERFTKQAFEIAKNIDK